MGIVNGVTRVLPNAHLLICWNHILIDLKFWLSKHGATQKDLAWYDSRDETIEDLSYLISQNNTPPKSEPYG